MKECPKCRQVSPLSLETCDCGASLLGPDLTLVCPNCHFRGKRGLWKMRLELGTSGIHRFVATPWRLRWQLNPMGVGWNKQDRAFYDCPECGYAIEQVAAQRGNSEDRVFVCVLLFAIAAFLIVWGLILLGS
jgi:hypothetical protein